MMETLIQIGLAAGTAAVYGGYAYLTKKLPDPEGTAFEGKKFLGTVVVGGIVGGVMNVVGMEVTEGAVIAAMVTIGAVEVSQKFLKPIFNWLEEKLG